MLAILCLLPALAVCNKVEDKTLDHETADDIEYSYSEGCDENAGLVCAVYYRCTGYYLEDCLKTVCNQLDDTARACIHAVESCEEIRQCLPQQGDDGIFGDDDGSDDDDDTGDDDDAADDDDDATDDELLKNKDFDLGPTPAWLEDSQGGYDLIQHQDDVNETDSHTPGYLVYMGGYNNAADELYQTVTLPADASTATFSCYLKIATLETAGANDVLRMRLLDSGGSNLLDIAQYSNQDADASWTLKEWDISVSSWAGQQVRFYLDVNTNESDTTSFFVDTCSFLVSSN